MRPTVPTMAKMTEKERNEELADRATNFVGSEKSVILANIDNNFSVTVVLGVRIPLCRNHRSAANAPSRKIVVMTQPVTNSGLRRWAPISSPR